MASLAGVFWLTSWPPHWLPVDDDFPNCVSACWDSDFFAVGCVSIRRTCSIFATHQEFEFESRGNTGWDERHDGHFCGFPIPPTSPSATCSNPSGFNLHLSLETVGWSVPYWMMFALWALILVKTRRSLQYNVRDILGIMLIIALTFAMFRLRVALLGILLLNFSTFLLFLHFLTSTIRSLIETNNILWPIFYQEQVKEAPSAAKSSV